MPRAPWLAPIDFVAFDDVRERQRLKAKVDIVPVSLRTDEIDALISFLNALTGTESVKGRLGKPAHVPSGLRAD